MQRFTRIKYNGSKVTLEWVVARGDHEDEHRLVSTELPAPSLPEALASFRVHVGKLLELPELWTAGLRIIGLAINEEEDGRRGLVVTALKELGRANAPLILNTPHLREQLRADEIGNFLPDEMLAALNDAIDAANEYLRGERAQGSLFPTAAAAAAGGRR